MAVEHDTSPRDDEELPITLAPPPVPGGIYHFEGAGRIVDWLVGTRRIERKVAARLAHEWGPTPQDPPSVDEPPPVPD